MATCGKLGGLTRLDFDDVKTTNGGLRQLGLLTALERLHLRLHVVCIAAGIAALQGVFARRDTELHVSHYYDESQEYVFNLTSEGGGLAGGGGR